MAALDELSRKARHSPPRPSGMIVGVFGSDKTLTIVNVLSEGISLGPVDDSVFEIE